MLNHYKTLQLSNFFIVLPIHLKMHFLFHKAKCAHLRGFARPTAPDWHGFYYNESSFVISLKQSHLLFAHFCSKSSLRLLISFCLIFLPISTWCYLFKKTCIIQWVESKVSTTSMIKNLKLQRYVTWESVNKRDSLNDKVCSRLKCLAKGHQSWLP